MVSKKLKYGTFLVIALLVFFSGFFLYFCLPSNPDDFPSDFTGLCRQLHGAAAFISLLSLGYMMSAHVQKHIKKWRRNIDGVVHLSVWALLVMSGYLLYYPFIDSFTWLNMSAVHWYLGLLLVVILVVHVVKQRGVFNARLKLVSKRFNEVGLLKLD